MSLASVTTMGYKIGTVGLVTTMGYSQGAAPPPPPPQPTTQPPYGPALTPAERARWFGDYESPISREERKKKRELEQRLALGIIKELVVPKELKEEVKEVVKEAVKNDVEFYRPAQIDFSPTVARIAFQVANDLVLELKRERKLERDMLEAKRLEDEAEEEAVEAFTLWMMN